MNFEIVFSIGMFTAVILALVGVMCFSGIQL